VSVALSSTKPGRFRNVDVLSARVRHKAERILMSKPGWRKKMERRGERLERLRTVRFHLFSARVVSYISDSVVPMALWMYGKSEPEMMAEDGPRVLWAPRGMEKAAEALLKSGN
jgi:hypothetical protein